MLNSSELHLNDRDTTHSVNNICHILSKWCKQICMGNTLKNHKLINTCTTPLRKE